MGAWFKIALEALAQRDTEMPMCFSQFLPLKY